MRVGIIGAGITGISLATYHRRRGHIVTVFEKQARAGGVWINQSNSTSKLQIHSYMYKFYEGVKFNTLFSSRDEILEQLNGVINRNKIRDSIQYETTVTKVLPIFKPNSQELIGWSVATDKGQTYDFDLLFIAIGLHGKLRELPSSFINDATEHGIQVINCCGIENGLDSVDFSGKNVVILGSGSFGIETMRTAKERGAKNIKLLGSNPTWVLPSATLATILMFLGFFRNIISPIITWLLAQYYRMKGFGHFLPSHLGYDDVVSISREFFEQNPSDVILIDRTNKQWPTFSDEKCVHIIEKHSQKDVKLDADIIVNATGWKPVDFSFLPEIYRPKQTDNSFLYMYQWHPEAGLRLCFSNYLTGAGTNGTPLAFGFFPELILNCPETFPNKQDMQKWIDYETQHNTSLRFQVTNVGHVIWKINQFMLSRPKLLLYYLYYKYILRINI
jgi:cation diffusion facilitator CzcD-associated flavoprotein CzcO